MYLEIMKHFFITENRNRILKKVNLEKHLGCVSGTHVKDSPQAESVYIKIQCLEYF